MTDAKSGTAPGWLTLSIGVLFAGLHAAVLLLLGLSALFKAVSVSIDPRVFLPAMALGLLVGIVYLAGRGRPGLRLVPSILWIVLALTYLGGGLIRDTRRGVTLGTILVLLMVGVLVYHAYVDVKALLAHSRA